MHRAFDEGPDPRSLALALRAGRHADAGARRRVDHDRPRLVRRAARLRRHSRRRLLRRRVRTRHRPALADARLPHGRQGPSVGAARDRRHPGRRRHGEHRQGRPLLHLHRGGARREVRDLPRGHPGEPAGLRRRHQRAHLRGAARSDAASARVRRVRDSDHRALGRRRLDGARRRADPFVRGRRGWRGPPRRAAPGADREARRGARDEDVRRLDRDRGPRRTDHDPAGLRLRERADLRARRRVRGTARLERRRAALTDGIERGRLQGRRGADASVRQGDGRSAQAHPRRGEGAARVRAPRALPGSAVLHLLLRLQRSDRRRGALRVGERGADRRPAGRLPAPAVARRRRAARRGRLARRDGDDVRRRRPGGAHRAGRRLRLDDDDRLVGSFRHLRREAEPGRTTGSTSTTASTRTWSAVPKVTRSAV